MPTPVLDDVAKVLDQPDFVFVRGPEDVELLRSRLRWIVEQGTALGVDTETTGLCPVRNQVRLVQVATENEALLVDLDGWRVPGERAVPWEAAGLRELKAVLESSRLKVLQNASFDIAMLWCEGVRLHGPFFDTMIAAKVFNNGMGLKNDLGSLTERTLKVTLPKELQKANWAGEITDEMKVYAARDAIVLPRLMPPLANRLRESEVKNNHTLMNVFELEMQCLLPVSLMQVHGFGFDGAGALELKLKLEMEAEEKLQPFLEMLDAEIRKKHPDAPEKWLPREPDGSFNTRTKTSGSIRLGTKVYAGYNPRAPKQTAARFEDAGVILPPDKKGNPSLDKDLLSFLRADCPLIEMYLQWKNIMTAISQVETLLEHLHEDGRIHGNYRQMGTETGRMSAAEPNLQQIKRITEFRRLFRARPGYVLVGADFSQIELRIAAELSGEERMLEAYRAGRDLHMETACLMTGKTADQVTKQERTSSKIVNFGLLFGAGPATLRKQAMAQYGVAFSHPEAKSYVKSYREAYPTLYNWQDTEGNKTTKAVYTLIGRRRILVGFNDKYTTRLNTQVQGSAGDIAKMAISLIWKQINKYPEGVALLICMCHDELILEVREEHAERWQLILQRCMERAGAAVCKAVPIVAEASHGACWADLK